MSLVAILRVIAFYLLAVVVATVLGSLVQAQINLAALAQIPASFGDRLAGTAQELPGLLLPLGMMVAVALLCTLPVAEALARIFRPWRGLLFALTGAAGIWLAFKIVVLYLTAPVSITAPSGSWQWIAMLVAVAIGSWLFGHLTRPRAKRGLRVLG